MKNSKNKLLLSLCVLPLPLMIPLISSCSKDLHSNNLSFKDNALFNWGDSSIYVLDSKINEKYLKELIIEHKDEVFENANLLSNDDLNKILTINKIRKDNGQGFASINLSFNQNSINLNNDICIQGFKQFDENTIKPPSIANEDFCTEEEFNNELNFLKNLPLGINQYYLNQDQLNNLDDYSLYDDLIDIRTNKAPYFFYEARPFDINIDSFTIDKDNNLIKCVFSLEGFGANSHNFQATFEKDLAFELYSLDEKQKNELLDKVLNKLKIESTNLSHNQIKAKNFQRYNVNEIKKYLKLNIDEINKIFYVEPGYFEISNHFIVAQNHPYDFKDPTSLDFEIQANFKNSLLIKTKIQKVDGFEKVITQDQLDLEPIKKLITPQNSISYKGQLEKFYFDEFISTTETNYKDVLNKTTNEEIKLEMMYQIRFSLYQMFGDNFSEINYYISNEKNQNGQFSFNAIGEGIINKTMDNRFYGFQNSIATSCFNATTNLKVGDKVKIEIVFDTWRSSNSTHIDPKPSLINRGVWGHTYAWLWNYDNNCDNLMNNYSGMTKDDVPRNNWSCVQNIRVMINNSYTIDEKINQYNFPWLSKQYIIPKN